MNNEIKQIAQRLKTFRESMDLSQDIFAQVCEMTVEEYRQMEEGNVDIPVGALNRISCQYGIELSILMFGDESHMHSYYVTRANTGPSIERTKAYKYEGLAVGFQDRKTSPFIVTVEPRAEVEIYLNHHEGQEFNYILEGSIAIHINQKVIELHPGDSIYFDARLKHAIVALNDEPAKLLAMII